MALRSTPMTVIVVVSTVFLLALSLGFTTAAQCTDEVFCDGTILSTVQGHRFYPDDKSFVDRVIDPTRSEEEFRRLWGEFSVTDRLDGPRVKNFIEDWTLPPGEDIVAVEPVDFTPNPAFLDNLPPALKPFGADLHLKWKSLVRTAKPLPYAHSSLIPVPHPFVVAGGRFREWYNWDSYWILLGLFVSNMPHTAADMIRNHLFCIKTYGYVPNGGRIYYLNRSQPPVLSLSVWQHYQRFGDLALVEEAYPLLVKEYEYWMSEQHAVVVTDRSGSRHVLNRYNVNTSKPRPESWYKDWEVAQEAFKTEKEQQQFYADIASAAESGWDFSSRWFRDLTNIHTIRTSQVVPVDLNAILYTMEKNLALMAQLFQDEAGFERFTAAKQRRALAIYRVLWSAELNSWFDYDLETHSLITHRPSKLQSGNVSGGRGPGSEMLSYLSQYLPIWAGASHLPTAANNQILRDLIHRQLQPGGLAASNQKVPQQWDEPNVWAPLHFFISEGLHNGQSLDELQHYSSTASNGQGSGTPIKNTSPELMKMVNTWVSATYCSWNSSPEHPIYEKYDARSLGMPGGGGEYDVQTGFGWSNGLALLYLERHADQIKLMPCPKKKNE